MCFLDLYCSFMYYIIHSLSCGLLLSTINHLPFWCWICWCTCCCTPTMVPMWPLSPSFWDIFPTVAIIPNFVNWDTRVIVVYSTNFLRANTCCCDYSYTSMATTSICSIGWVFSCSTRISYVVAPPFISLSIIDYTSCVFPLAFASNWFMFDVIKLSFRVT